MAIGPSTRLSLTPRGQAARVGLFATADESGMTVVYLSGAPIPLAARRPLEDLLSTRPEHFLDAQRGQSFLLGRTVRLTPDGVFVADQKVIGLDQLVETIAREDVQRITSAGKTGGSASWAAAGAAGGAVLGMMSAVRIAFSPCRGSCTDEEALIGLSLVGLPVLGGVLGYKAGSHDVERIIYSAQ